MTGFVTITAATLLSGILDLSATATVMKAQGIPFERLLHGIASGALGKSSFQGGKKTAVLASSFIFLSRSPQPSSTTNPAAGFSFLSTIHSSAAPYTASRSIS